MLYHFDRPKLNYLARNKRLGERQRSWQCCALLPVPFVSFLCSFRIYIFTEYCAFVTFTVHLLFLLSIYFFYLLSHFYYVQLTEFRTPICMSLKKLSSLSFVVIIINHNICDHD
jgi:hypothetical protein